MNDRKLLELAAKAAGQRIVEWAKDGNGVDVAIIIRGDGDGFSKRPWQPLLENQMTDADGDALRLAVKLNLAISIEEGQSWAHSEQVMMGSPVQHDGTDPCAATRRAITRAAAEIGKGMK
jgi:hypothetical protein